MGEYTKTHIDEFIHNDYSATERKYLPVDQETRELLERNLQQNRTRITQLQLSHTSEPYSLCMRKHTPDNREPDFRVEIKNVGIMTDDGWYRMQTAANIDRELFEQYEKQDLPVTKKWRTYPLNTKDVHIDFFDNGHVHAKSRNPRAWAHFIRAYDLAERFREVTGNPVTDTEWHAHNDYKRTHGGREILAPRVGPTIDQAVSEVKDWIAVHDKKPFIQISGRSGSGKTYFAYELSKVLAQQNVPINAPVLSTDEYNRGRTVLYRVGGGTWTNYDSDIVWNTKRFRRHMEKLRRGEPIPHEIFDYEIEERVKKGIIDPNNYDAFIYEGVKSHHPDLHGLADIAYEIPTPLATSLGRRIVRDLMTRPRFANPQENLRYYLTYAEPEYIKLYDQSN